MKRQAKEPPKTTCLYKKDGADARDIIKRSFQIFVRQELAKSGATALSPNHTINPETARGFKNQ